MSSTRSLSAVATMAIVFLLASTIDGRCHNLSSTAFTHCPRHSGEASGIVKAASTAPYPMKAMATGAAKKQQTTQKVALVKAQENLPTDTSADTTPWLYGQGGKLKARMRSYVIARSRTLGQKLTPCTANQTLPAPSATLMTVALGTGTQNYTCPSNPSATPTQVGATAELYHLSEPSQSVSSISIEGLPAIGKHYFNSAGTPSFQFFDDKALGLLQAAKKMSIPAPGGAGVPWLQLVTTGTGKGNLQEVYRVQTQGGSPPRGFCSGKAAGTPFEIPYRAQYWFYGTGS